MDRCGPGTRCGFNHMTGLNLTGFMVPGGNGLPDLTVNANDPAGWVTMQIAARQPNGGNIPTPKDIAETAAVGAVANVAPDWVQRLVDAVFAKFPNPKDYFKGMAVAGVLLLVALGFIILGAYQITKD